MVQLYVSTHTYNQELQKAVTNVTLHFPDYSDTYLQCGCFLLVVYFAIINFRTVPLDKKIRKMNSLTWIMNIFGFPARDTQISAAKGSHSNSKLYQESYAARRPDVTPFVNTVTNKQSASEWSSSATESSWRGCLNVHLARAFRIAFCIKLKIIAFPILLWFMLYSSASFSTGGITAS